MVDSSKGKIESIVGCMFAGKTEELLRRIRRAEIAEKNIQAFTQSEDTRYGDACIGSHSGEKYEATLVDDSEDIIENINDEVEVVAIDEANFFSEDLISVVQQLAEDGVRVIVCGLDQNFRGEPFHPVPELMAVSDEIEKLKAVCLSCSEMATRTQRLDGDGNPAKEEEKEILVSGGGRFYEPRCRDCHQLRE